MNQRGEALTIVLVAIVAIGAGAFGLSKTKWFHGDTKRANQASETTTALVEATTKQGAVAAASVVKIGEANSTAPDSPEKSFIGREVPVALASLPKPDPEALLAAERRKVAVMEGRLAEASSLYGDALKRADMLEKERTEALQAKREADAELQRVAAERLGAEKQAFWMWCGIGALVALYLWTKLTHLSPAALAEAVSDIKNGPGEEHHAIRALDGVTSRFQQSMVRLTRKVFHE